MYEGLVCYSGLGSVYEIGCRSRICQVGNKGPSWRRRRDSTVDDDVNVRAFGSRESDSPTPDI